MPQPDPIIAIDWLGGNCPVQAEGTINGKAFYFRSRGEIWSLGIGGDDPCGNPEWEHKQWFGKWPDAGWITDTEAEDFIKLAAQKYANGEPGGRLEDVAARFVARYAWLKRGTDV